MIDYDATKDLWHQFANGAVLDGKTFREVKDPWMYCRNIVLGWRND